MNIDINVNVLVNVVCGYDIPQSLGGAFTLYTAYDNVSYKYLNTIITWIKISMDVNLSAIINSCGNVWLDKVDLLIILK